MYSIYCDGHMIYAPPVVNDGYIAHSAHITKELNKVDTLEFTIPTTGKGYDMIQKLKSVITVKDGDEIIFKGRCLNIEQDFYNQRQFSCEGVLGYLNDSVLRPYSFSTDTPGNIFKYYIEEHNEVVDADKQFTVGNISSMQSDQIVRDSNLYPTTLDEIQDKLIESYGGYVIPRYGDGVVYLDYRARSGGDNGQVIQFGKNLLDLSQFMDASEVKTVLVPLGASTGGEEAPGQETHVTIKSVNDGKDYVESASGIALFGRIETCEGWDDITEPANLLTAAQARMTELIAESVTLELSAIDLSMLDVDVDRIRLGEYNRVLSIPHSLDDYFQCSRITLDLSDPRQSSYTFGNPRPTLTDSINRYRLS